VHDLPILARCYLEQRLLGRRERVLRRYSQYERNLKKYKGLTPLPLLGIDRKEGEIISFDEIVDKLKRHIENDKKIEQRSIKIDPDEFVNR